MSRQKVHIINSAYNPKDGWELDYIERALELQNNLIDYELTFILVNDGSTHDLAPKISIIKSNLRNFKLVTYNTNHGKGHAIRKGVQSNEADFYLYTDLDFPYTFMSYKNLIDFAIKSKADVVIGTRNKSYFASIPLQRKVISLALIALNKYIFHLPYPDTQAGIKLINHKATKVFNNVKTNGFLFEVEFLKQAIKTLKVEDQEVSLRPNIILSSISPLKLIKLFTDYIKL